MKPNDVCQIVIVGDSNGLFSVYQIRFKDRIVCEFSSLRLCWKLLGMLAESGSGEVIDSITNVFGPDINQIVDVQFISHKNFFCLCCFDRHEWYCRAVETDGDSQIVFCSETLEIALDDLVRQSGMISTSSDTI